MIIMIISVVIVVVMKEETNLNIGSLPKRHSPNILKPNNQMGIKATTENNHWKIMPFES